MSSYASHTKLAELRLADEPELATEAPADADAPAPAASDATAVDQATGPPTATMVTELRLVDVPDLPLVVPIEIGVPPFDPNGAADDVVANCPPSPAKTREFRLQDEPAEAGEPPVGADAALTPFTSFEIDIDSTAMAKYLAAATREFDSGNIDQPLWIRAVNRAGANEDGVKAAYLRARATAMRVTERNKVAELATRLAREANGKPDGAGVRQSALHRRLENEEPARAADPRSRFKRPILIAIALAIVVAAAGYLTFRFAGDPALPTVASRPAPPARPTAQAANPSATNSAAVKATDDDRPNMPNEAFVRKVQELKEANNWHVLVLYAVEWTRKFPASPDAWNELSMGYVRLRQFNDALETATKAVQLAPDNFQAWQNLGEVNAALQLPVAALVAYERAAELNTRDVTSLVQIGTLNAQLGRLPQARMAFANALDVNPLDADALCGAASIAQKEGRPKDGEAYARQLKSASLQCRGASAVEFASVAPVPAAKKSPVAAATR